MKLGEGALWLLSLRDGVAENLPFTAEFGAILDLLARLFFDWRTGTLMLLLAGAAVYDFRFHRIPNWLVLSGVLFAVIYNTAQPPWSQGSILFPLAGLGVGLALFLPLYLVRAMGAGDVKLLAMIGAFLGPGDTFRAALASMIVGGAMAIAFVLARGTATRMYRNLASLFRLGVMNTVSGSVPSLQIPAGMSAGRLPYGVAIGIGTSGYLIAHQLGFL